MDIARLKIITSHAKKTTGSSIVNYPQVQGLWIWPLDVLSKRFDCRRIYKIFITLVTPPQEFSLLRHLQYTTVAPNLLHFLMA
jgi:hypothetical protein